MKIPKGMRLQYFKLRLGIFWSCARLLWIGSVRLRQPRLTWMLFKIHREQIKLLMEVYESWPQITPTEEMLDAFHGRV